MTREQGTWPWPDEPPSAAHRAAYAEAEPIPFWLDTPDRPRASPPLEGEQSCGLAIVGGGLSGLWAAVLAKQRDPARDVVLVESERVAHAASGRNGGFFLSSLTHGIANGFSRFPREMPKLERLGLENHEAAVATIRDHGIDCDLELNGDILLALEPHEEEGLAEAAEQLRDLGHEVELLDRKALAAEVVSPLYRAGLWQRSGSGLIDPARLCWGLQRVAAGMGVRVHEETPIEEIESGGDGVTLRTAGGRLRTEHALLATSAFPGLVGAIRRRIVPVYDYVLVTEALDDSRRAAIGWSGRQGLGDSANQFHYYRQTRDNRILFGGFDAVYHYGNGLRPELDQSDESCAMLAQHFFTTFPQLEGIRFTHRWGGAIDTCSRFFAFAGSAHGGRVAYTVGHTGLGVGASRFGAGLALDLVDGVESEATRLNAMRTKPFPFPPEPLRWAVINATRNRLDAADRRQGRRGLWLRGLDRLGLGFDS